MAPEASWLTRIVDVVALLVDPVIVSLSDARNTWYMYHADHEPRVHVSATGPMTTGGDVDVAV